jgi:hypothetical protein
LVVTGGVGIGGALFLGGNLDVAGTGKFIGTLNIGNATANPSLKFATGGSTTYSASITLDSNVDIFNISGGNTAVYNDGSTISLMGSSRYGTYAGGVLSLNAGNSSNNTAYGYISLGTANTERLRISYTGNVGINTSTFNYAGAGTGYLAINGSTSNFLEFQYGTTGTSGWITGNSSTLNMMTSGPKDLLLGVAAGEKLRITNGGGVNIGTGGANVFYNGLSSFSLDMASVELFSYSGQLYQFNNCVHNGSSGFYYKYSGSGVGGMVVENAGNITFVTAPSGTAGNLVTLTTRMTIAQGGAVTIPGSLSKGSGSFRIEHPLESLSETHQLVHSFIEGPQADLIYRGKLTLINGKAQANIDEVSTMSEGTFEALCREVQCFTTNESGWDLIKGKVIGNIIYIESQNANSTDEISWMVIGERKDKHMMNTEWTDENGKVIVEPLKPIESTQAVIIPSPVSEEEIITE